MKNKKKINTMPLTFIVGIPVLLLLIILIIGLFLPSQINKKIVLDLNYPPALIWDRLADNDFQLVWRTNIVNIEKIASGTNKTIYKEIYNDDSFDTYEIREWNPGRKVVKYYKQESREPGSLTVIILPAQTGGTSTIFIRSLHLNNPFTKILIKLGVKNKNAEFSSFMEYITLFTNNLKQNTLL